MAEAKFWDPYINRVPDEVIDFDPAEGKTKQEFSQEADLNFLLKRYTETGVPPDTVGVGRYEDFMDAPDFLQAQVQLVEAKRQFSLLNAQVRERFRNDPAEFLAFVHDEKNFDEALKMGLLSEEAASRKAAEKAAESKILAEPPK